MHTDSGRILLSVSAQNGETSDEIEKELAVVDAHYKVQSRNLSGAGLNMLAHLKCSDADALMKKIYSVEGVTAVSVVPDTTNTEI